SGIRSVTSLPSGGKRGTLVERIRDLQTRLQANLQTHPNDNSGKPVILPRIRLPFQALRDFPGEQSPARL
ncbi:MAG TPA: hypothetical protein VI140_04475, partial [Oxalicibacterium sp.]